MLAELRKDFKVSILQVPGNRVGFLLEGKRLRHPLHRLNQPLLLKQEFGNCPPRPTVYRFSQSERPDGIDCSFVFRTVDRLSATLR